MKAKPTYTELERRVKILEKENLQLRQSVNELHGDEDKARDLEEMNAANYNQFTPKELRIANLIKRGKTTKEIAGIMTSSVRTIEFHRSNMRHKFGLKGNASLRFHLLTIR